MKLNLPDFDCRITRDGELTRIYDRLRRRYVALTPDCLLYTSDAADEL